MRYFTIFIVLSTTFSLLLPISHQLALLNIQNSDIDPIDPLPVWTVYSNDNIHKKEDGTIVFVENRQLMDRLNSADDYDEQNGMSNDNLAGIQKSSKNKPGKQRTLLKSTGLPTRANARNWNSVDQRSGSLPLIEAPVLMSNPFWKLLSRARAYYRQLQYRYDNRDRTGPSPLQSRL